MRIQPMIIWIITFVLFACCAKSIAADEDFCDELPRLAVRPMLGDLFGASMDRDGDLLLVGGKGIGRSGGAHLFDIRNPDDPVLISTLTAEGHAFSNAGTSVVLSPPYAFLGAVTESTGAPWSGAVFVFDISNPAAPTQIQILKSPVPLPDGFMGFTMAFQNGDLAVGQPLSEPGQTHVFRLTVDGTFEWRQTLENGETDDNEFGSTVFFANDSLYVSAERATNPPATQSFKSILYQFDSTKDGVYSESRAYAARELLKPTEVGGGADFFMGVSIHGNLLAFSKLAWPSTITGAVWLFDISDQDNPVLITEITPSDGEAFDAFGSTIALTRDTLIVSADGVGNETHNSIGAVYLYDVSNPANPLFLHKLNHPPVGLKDNVDYGLAIGSAGHTVFVGAEGSSIDGLHTGSLFRYECTNMGCPEDINGDRTVNVNDLLLLLPQYGKPHAIGEIAAPFAEVGFEDLLQMFAAWGDC